jgi:hypothetical protein
MLLDAPSPPRTSRQRMRMSAVVYDRRRTRQRLTTPAAPADLPAHEHALAHGRPRNRGIL